MDSSEEKTADVTPECVTEMKNLFRRWDAETDDQQSDIITRIRLFDEIGIKSIGAVGYPGWTTEIPPCLTPLTKRATIRPTAGGRPLWKLPAVAVAATADEREK
jgi:hypothetical protein